MTAQFRPLSDPDVRREAVTFLLANWPGMLSEHHWFPELIKPRVCHGRPRASDSEYNWKWLSEHHPLPRWRTEDPPTRQTLDAELARLGAERGASVLMDPASTFTVRFVTSPVVFEVEGDDPLDLGPFRVDLKLSALDASCRWPETGVTATALAPFLALDTEETTHPHVQGGDVCLGQGQGPFETAMTQGRFDDAADVIDALLHTYNPSSPYFPVEKWRGRLCPNCDDRSNSVQACHCAESFCAKCSDQCGNCGSYYHVSCGVRCADCNRLGCANCFRAAGDDPPADAPRYCERCRRGCYGCSLLFRRGELDDGYCAECRAKRCRRCGDERGDLDDDGVCESCQRDSCANCGRETDHLNDDGDCIRCYGERCNRCESWYDSDDLDDDGYCEDCAHDTCSDCHESVPYGELEDDRCWSCRHRCSECNEHVDSEDSLEDGVCPKCRRCTECNEVQDSHDDLLDGLCPECKPDCAGSRTPRTT